VSRPKCWVRESGLRKSRTATSVPLRDGVSRIDFASGDISFRGNLQVVENEGLEQFAAPAKIGHRVARGIAQVAFLDDPLH
jgi:hypothetical protein